MSDNETNSQSNVSLKDILVGIHDIQREINGKIVRSLNDLANDIRYVQRIVTSIESDMLDQKKIQSKFVLNDYRYIRKLLRIKTIANNNKLIRIGGEHDGGYIMLDDFIRGGIAYSFGINNDVQWDNDMADLGYHIYMYDHTVHQLPKQRKEFHFFRQGISGSDRSPAFPLNTLEYYLKENQHLNKEHMILKMDVEGAEWDWLSSVREETLMQFDQIVMEMHGFHALDMKSLIFSGLEKLTKTHSVIHIHGNNYGPVVWREGVPFSCALEILWINHKTYETVESTDAALLTEFDQPCWNNRDDIILARWND